MALDSPELELQGIVDTMWVPGTESRSPARVFVLVSAEPVPALA